MFVYQTGCGQKYLQVPTRYISYTQTVFVAFKATPLNMGAPMMPKRLHTAKFEGINDAYNLWALRPKRPKLEKNAPVTASKVSGLINS